MKYVRVWGIIMRIDDRLDLLDVLKGELVGMVIGFWVKLGVSFR